LGMCVASGKPFLGCKVKKGRVLVLDYENGLPDTDWIIEQQSKYLNLERPEEDFLVWPFSHTDKHGHIMAMIQEIRPSLVIVDSLRSCLPQMEAENSYAAEEIRKLKELSRQIGGAILFLHHIRKNREDESGKLDGANLMEWLQKAAGA